MEFNIETPIIRFSHDYPKLHGQKKAELYEVEEVEFKDLHPDFIEYDTVFIVEHAIGMFSDEITEHYPLPKGRLLVLYFIGEKRIPFTTVRRYTNTKAAYYCSLRKREFNVVIGET